MSDELINIDNLPKRNPYNTYPNHIKLRVFAYKNIGYSESMISRTLQLPKSTIHGWLKKRPSDLGIDEDVVATYAERLGKELGDDLIIKAKTCIDNAMHEDKISRSSSKDLSVMASIFIEKAQLIKGKPTSNNFTYIKKQDRNHDELNSLQDELKIIDIELNEKRDEN